MPRESRREGLNTDIHEQFKSIFTNEFCHVHDYYRRSSGSVKNVITALSDISEISHMRITLPFSWEDVREKRDLVVYMKDFSGDNSLTEIGIQIKSSDYFALEFLQEINIEQKEAWSELARQKLILINGQNPADKIQQDFRDQLKDIMEHRVV